jgi:hypothetical protein
METKTLKPGNYMKTTSVIKFFSNAPTHLVYVEKCEKHIGEYDVYFSTADLKNIMSENMFREMESECVTHMILS